MAYTVKELKFRSRRDAELAISNLKDISCTYDYATVQDLYDLAGEPTYYLDRFYGWIAEDLEKCPPIISRAYEPYTYIVTMPLPRHFVEEEYKKKNSCNPCSNKTEDINLQIIVAEMESVDVTVDIINGVIKANPGRKINITIE